MVAKSGGILVGFVYASFTRDFPFEISETVGAIDDVYVLPAFRGRKIGEGLVVECVSKLKAENVDAVRLTVLVENGAAIRLYEKLGFRIDRHVMIKSLRH